MFSILRRTIYSCTLFIFTILCVCLCGPRLGCFIFNCPITGTGFFETYICMYVCMNRFIFVNMPVYTYYLLYSLKQMKYYVNQLLLFKYWNLGGYNRLNMWLKLGRYERNVWGWKTDEILRLILCGIEMCGTDSLYKISKAGNILFVLYVCMYIHV
jgi:hypothetical protein